MSLIPDSHKDLLEDESKALCYLATTMNDGSPQVSPVWFNFDGDHIFINSTKGRLKDRNMRARPHVAMTIMRLDSPYRYILLRGRILEIISEGANEHIHTLSHKYMGKDWDIPEGQIRYIYKFIPEKVHVS